MDNLSPISSGLDLRGWSQMKKKKKRKKQRQISRLFEGLAANSTARATRPNRAAPVVIRCQDSCLQPITELLFRRQPQETDSLER